MTSYKVDVEKSACRGQRTCREWKWWAALNAEEMDVEKTAERMPDCGEETGIPMRGHQPVGKKGHTMDVKESWKVQEHS